jgi:hypothetical protein
MSDPGKVIVALGFFTSLTYIVRLITLGAVSYRKHDAQAGRGLVVDEDRMARLEQAVEAIALEVERISEGQRFTTKLLAERAAADRLPAGASSERRPVTPH